MISIDTTSIKAGLQNRVDYIWHVQKATDFFNSPKFDRKARTLVCTHEAVHLYYERECGFEPKLFGPSIEYDSSAREFYPSVGAVQSLPDRVSMTADPILVGKSFLAPKLVQEKLLGFQTSGHIEVGDEIDVQHFNNWHARRLQLKGDVSLVTTEVVRDAVHRDLRSPAFRKKLWDAARDFEARVFGPEAIGSREAA